LIGRTVLHDFDLPLYTRRTSLKRSAWLFLHAIFGDRVARYMPIWLRNEKYNLALALAMIDKSCGVRCVFALTDEVDKVFPTIRNLLVDMGFSVVPHWHVKQRVVGYSNVAFRGRWRESDVDYRRVYGNYDREYVKGNTKLPDTDTYAVWHVDHMPFNLPYYLDFLERLKNCDNAERLHS
jgi:hypothetical protein